MLCISGACISLLFRVGFSNKSIKATKTQINSQQSLSSFSIQLYKYSLSLSPQSKASISFLIPLNFFESCMSWFGKLGFLLNYSNSSSNSNHFITCLLIFILHYSPQLPPSLFKFLQKTLNPLLLINTTRFHSYLINKNGVWTHQE
jgi:hypothetical protein